MMDPFVDTDVIIRLLTNDDPVKQAKAVQLFQTVETGKISLAAPDTVIADAVYVLSSPRLYHLERSQVQALLLPLLRLPLFKVQHKRALINSLEIYASSSLDFSDALIVSSMQQSLSQTLYSFDTDFDHIESLHRLEPEEVGSDSRQRV